MEWLIILAAVLAATGLGLAYLTACIARFGFIQKLSRGKKWPARLLSLAVIAAGFTVLALSMSVINAIIVLLHEVIFFLLFGLVLRVVRRVRGRVFRVHWQGWLALVFSAVYLTVGYWQCTQVRQTDYRLQTGKELGTLKIALIADSHIGTTFDGDGFAEQLHRIEAQSPDLLLIAGDFVDDGSNRNDLLRACEALGETRFPFGVWLVYGNHDAGYFSDRDFTAEELGEALRQNGVQVLEDRAELVDGRFYVAGRKDASLRSRKSADELLAGLDTGKYTIVLDHQPSDYENEARSAADLVLSGHTHGGQLIPITYVGKWFGLVDRVYGRETRNRTDFIVTSGISDWEILFKTGTRSEYVIITVEGAAAAAGG